VTKAEVRDLKLAAQVALLSKATRATHAHCRAIIKLVDHIESLEEALMKSQTQTEEQ
jgi:hypothetical protein